MFNTENKYQNRFYKKKGKDFQTITNIQRTHHRNNLITDKSLGALQHKQRNLTFDHPKAEHVLEDSSLYTS